MSSKQNFHYCNIPENGNKKAQIRLNLRLWRSISDLVRTHRVRLAHVWWSIRESNPGTGLPAYRISSL